MLNLVNVATMDATKKVLSSVEAAAFRAKFGFVGGRYDQIRSDQIRSEIRSDQIRSDLIRYDHVVLSDGRQLRVSQVKSVQAKPSQVKI